LVLLFIQSLTIFMDENQRPKIANFGVDMVKLDCASASRSLREASSSSSISSSPAFTQADDEAVASMKAFLWSAPEVVQVCSIEFDNAVTIVMLMALLVMMGSGWTAYRGLGCLGTRPRLFRGRHASLALSPRGGQID
jgi:hypothetical protein